MGVNQISKSRKPSAGGVVLPLYEYQKFAAAANAELADSAFWTSDEDFEVVSITEIHSTLGTDLGAVNVQVRKCTGTQAPSAGAALVTTAFDLKATVNTVVTGTLTATGADRRLVAGNRLAVDFTGVLTAVAGLCVTVKLQRR